MDLRREGERDGRAGRIYDEIAREMRQEYTRFIGDIGDALGDSIDWWLEAPASRNPVLSDLYHQVISLTLLVRLGEEGSPPRRIRVPCVRRSPGSPQ